MRGTVGKLNQSNKKIVFVKSDSGGNHLVSLGLLRVVSPSKGVVEEVEQNPKAASDEGVLTPPEAARRLSRGEIMTLQDHVRARMEVLDRVAWSRIYIGRKVWFEPGQLVPLHLTRASLVRFRSNGMREMEASITG